MDERCENCGGWVSGEDLGDHPHYLTYYCEECGRSWDSWGEVYDEGVANG